MYISKNNLIERAKYNLLEDLNKHFEVPLNARVELVHFSRCSKNQAYIEFKLPDYNDSYVVLIYVFTNVVTKKCSSTLELINTDSWYSATTKKLINQYSKLQVWQKNFEWFAKLNGITVNFGEIEGKFI